MSGFEIAMFIFAMVAMAAGLTTILCLVIGKRLLRQGKLVAMALCGLALPIAIALVGIIALILVGERGEEVVLMMTFMLCLWAVPTSLLTSYAMIETMAQRREEKDDVR